MNLVDEGGMWGLPAIQYSSQSGFLAGGASGG